MDQEQWRQQQIKRWIEDAADLTDDLDIDKSPGEWTEEERAAVAQTVRALADAAIAKLQDRG